MLISMLTIHLIYEDIHRLDVGILLKYVKYEKRPLFMWSLSLIIY